LLSTGWAWMLTAGGRGVRVGRAAARGAAAGEDDVADGARVENARTSEARHRPRSSRKVRDEKGLFFLGRGKHRDDEERDSAHVIRFEVEPDRRHLPPLRTTPAGYAKTSLAGIPSMIA